MANVWFLQHLRNGDTGLVGQVLAERGHAVVVRLPKYEDLPPEPPPDCHGVVVLGGPMSVHERERNPWFDPEERFIRAAVEAGRPVLGICLGSQLLASAMGARVAPVPPAEKQFGWHPVTLTAAGRDDPLVATLPEPGEGARPFCVFEWHGDGFGLPDGAELLADSPVYPHQAYRVGARGYGFHFHFELDGATIETWVGRSADYLRELGLDPAAILAGRATHLEALRRRGARLAAAFGELATRAAG